MRYGLLTRMVTLLKINGEYISNPIVYTDKWVNEKGKIIYGTPKQGEEKEEGKELLKSV